MEDSICSGSSPPDRLGSVLWTTSSQRDTERPQGIQYCGPRPNKIRLWCPAKKRKDSANSQKPNHAHLVQLLNALKADWHERISLPSKLKSVGPLAFWPCAFLSGLVSTFFLYFKPFQASRKSLERGGIISVEEDARGQIVWQGAKLNCYPHSLY